MAFAALTLVFVALAVPLWGNQHLASWYARALTRVTLPLLGVKVRVHSADRLARQPCIYVVNHQSALDALFLGCIYPPRTVIIGKRELVFMPIFGLLFMATGNILIDRADREKAIAGLDKAVAAVRRRGRSIWIFPEGTRNRTAELLGPFKKGAFHMALAAQVPIVPIVVDPLRDCIDPGARRIHGGTVAVHVLEPVPTASFSGGADALRDRVRQLMLEVLAAGRGRASA